MLNILIIDDEQECCDALEFFIENVGKYNIYKSTDGIEALGMIRKKKINLIFSDVNLPVINGIELTKIARHRKKDVIVVLISGKKDIINSINALEHGAFDFIPKPAEGKRIEEILKRVDLQLKKEPPVAWNPLQLTEMDEHTIISLEELLSRYPVNPIRENTYIGFFSEEIQNICHKLEKLGHYPEIPVLLEGKTGVGKEIFARHLHESGPGATGPFIGINCAAISKDLFEAELFGYEKGSFTGADPRGREGKIQLAERGTLFLDEITEIPLGHQSKLLRVVQEREYYRVGGREKRMVNTRIVCASNRNLEKLVQKKLFREDLYYRLNTCKVVIPPLKERKAEILPLSLLFLQELNIRNSPPVNGIESGFIKQLVNYDWPGNIRELKNLLLKTTLFSEQDVLRADDINLVNRKRSGTLHTLDPENIRLPEESLDLERFINTIILKALEKFSGNKTKTAAYLKIPRKRLYHRYNSQTKYET